MDYPFNRDLSFRQEEVEKHGKLFALYMTIAK